MIKPSRFGDYSNNSIALARDNLAIVFLLNRKSKYEATEGRQMEHVIGNLIIATLAMSTTSSFFLASNLAEAIVQNGGDTAEITPLVSRWAKGNVISYVASLAHIPYDAPELQFDPLERTLNVAEFIHQAHLLMPEAVEPQNYIGSGRDIFLGSWLRKIDDAH